MSEADGHDVQFSPLISYLCKVPAIEKNTTPSQGFGTGMAEDGSWWAIFSIDITHRLAWNVVQEFAYVLNDLSMTERLPTVFMPKSPPPYLNGGPQEYLSWVIECSDPSFKPKDVSEWLEGRLPRPVDDLSQWELTADEEPRE
jgi:hypothetical protein